MVTSNASWALVKSPSISAWCAHVTLTPEESKIIVFIKGTLKGSNESTPIGGHKQPNSTLGDRLLWKNAQKNDIKNITSEVINSIIPQRSPISTMLVCKPWNDPSREMSRHHWYITSSIIKVLTEKSIIDFEWNHITIPVVSPIAEIDANRGQGDISTKW